MSQKHRRKRRFRWPQRGKPQAPPGQLTPAPQSPPTTVRVFAYNEDAFIERTVTDLAELREIRRAWRVVWVDVEGLGDAGTIQALGEIFGLHFLALEDVLNTRQRAKVDVYEQHLFVISRMVSYGEHLESEQLSLFLGADFVVTFQYLPGDSLEPVRERIRKGQGRLRKAGADYLAYALLDAVIDGYFPVLDAYTGRLESLDEQILGRSPREAMLAIHDLRAELLMLRRAIWPHREALNALARDPNPLIGDETRLYLRDCLDHVVTIIDLVETYREMCSDLRDYFLSAAGQRTNEIMRLLTVIATVFMPLTFIAGVYGMNFDPDASPWNMPELRWAYGYPFALGLMAATTLALLSYFLRKGWLGAAVPEVTERPADD
jgi:magnesium transporter